ncbi:hypothetical protein KIF59_01895 [Enterobacter cloacae subsp. cloacae]|nr:hypothetical protein [Enterobacter cloacae subsp. cloacae]
MNGPWRRDCRPAAFADALNSGLRAAFQSHRHRRRLLHCLAEKFTQEKSIECLLDWLDLHAGHSFS